MLWELSTCSSKTEGAKWQCPISDQIPLFHSLLITFHCSISDPREFPCYTTCRHSWSLLHLSILLHANGVGLKQCVHVNTPSQMSPCTVRYTLTCPSALDWRMRMGEGRVAPKECHLQQCQFLHTPHWQENLRKCMWPSCDIPWDLVIWQSCDLACDY